MSEARVNVRSDIYDTVKAKAISTGPERMMKASAAGPSLGEVRRMPSPFLEWILL